MVKPSIVSRPFELLDKSVLEDFLAASERFKITKLGAGSLYDVEHGCFCMAGVVAIHRLTPTGYEYASPAEIYKALYQVYPEGDHEGFNATHAYDTLGSRNSGICYSYNDTAQFAYGAETSVKRYERVRAAVIAELAIRKQNAAEAASGA